MESMPPTDQPAEGVSAAEMMGGDDPESDVPGPDLAESGRHDAASSPTGPPSEQSATADSPAGSDPEQVPAGDLTERSSDDADSGTNAAIERTMVRITDDVGEIFGADERSYDLSAEDVVTLPAANAGPLVEKGAAERLD